MEIEQIYETLDKMLGDQKSRNFLNHLVRSYIPINKVSKVIETADPAFKCVLSKKPLITVSGVLETLKTEEIKNSFLTELKSFIDDKGINVSRTLANIIGEAQLAVSGKDTNTAMSYDTFQTFYAWVLKKSIEGDKHINWLLGSIRRENTVKTKNVKNSKPENKVKKTVKQTTYTLGQTSGELANLKSKLLNQEKNNV